MGAEYSTPETPPAQDNEPTRSQSASQEARRLRRSSRRRGPMDRTSENKNESAPQPPQEPEAPQQPIPQQSEIPQLIPDPQLYLVGMRNPNQAPGSQRWIIYMLRLFYSIISSYSARPAASRSQ